MIVATPARPTHPTHSTTARWRRHFHCRCCCRPYYVTLCFLLWVGVVAPAAHAIRGEPTMSGYGRPGGAGFEGLLTFISANYSKFDRPLREEVNITVLIHLESMRDISSDASLDFYLVQFWRDPRIRPIKSQLKVTGRVLPTDVWYPDTYFLLVRDLIYSDEEQYIVIDSQGDVEYNRKVKLSTPCSPNVMLFPFDVVKCNLVLTSFGYTREEINYLWLGSAANGGCYIDGKNNNVDHLGFFLMGTELKSGMIVYGGANYSSLETVIYLKRKYSAYIMQVYFPAALIVILSWTIFWINLHATPARASLGVTTVLTMLTLATQSTAHNEKHVNNKVTAIDIYLWVCFVFVIFAMIEFALSDFTTHRHLDEMSFTIRDDNSSRDDDDCILLVNRNANHKRLSAAVKESLSSHRKRNRYSPTRIKPYATGQQSGGEKRLLQQQHCYGELLQIPEQQESFSEDESYPSPLMAPLDPLSTGNTAAPATQHRLRRTTQHHKQCNGFHPNNNNNNNNNINNKNNNNHNFINNNNDTYNKMVQLRRSCANGDANCALQQGVPSVQTVCLFGGQRRERERQGLGGGDDSSEENANQLKEELNDDVLDSDQELTQLNSECKEEAALSLMEIVPQEMEKRKIHSLNMINNVARVLFPVLFLTFNLVYWIALLFLISNNESYQLSSYFTSLDHSH